MDEIDPLEDLVNIVKILIEESDKLAKLQENGAQIDRNFFVFTCLGECQDTYAINSISRDTFRLISIESIPEEGQPVEDVEEIICIIESLLEFVENTPGIRHMDDFFMDRLNPNKYTPGSCFSPC